MYSYLDATNLLGHVDYWCEWPRKEGKFISADEYTPMKIRFLESKLFWPNGLNYFRCLPEGKRKKNNIDENIFIGMQMGRYYSLQVSYFVAWN